MGMGKRNYFVHIWFLGRVLDSRCEAFVLLLSFRNLDIAIRCRYLVIAGIFFLNA